MSDEEKLHIDASRAHRAKSALDEFGFALDALEADYIKAWKETPARDTDARERLWQAVQIVGKVRAHLTKAIADGKLAERELAEIARLGKRRKILGIV